MRPRGPVAYDPVVRPLFRPVALASTLLLAPAPVASVASAQEAPGATGYEGVSPGTGTPPAARRLERRTGARAQASILTWPGFTAQAGGGSRFFVQTTAPVTTEVRTTADRVEVIFRNTRIHLANSRRWLETRHFETPVLRARLERRGRDMVLVMHLRGAATPTVSSGAGEGGFHFVYVDFPAGHWLPAEPEPMPEPRGGVSVVSGGETSADAPAPPAVSPSGRELADDERPPPIQRGPQP